MSEQDLLVIDQPDGSVVGVPIEEPNGAAPPQQPSQAFAVVLGFPDGHEETRSVTGPDMQSVRQFVMGMGHGMAIKPHTASIFRVGEVSYLEIDSAPAYDARLAFELMQVLLGPTGVPGERPMDALGYVVTPALHQLIMWKKTQDTELMQGAIDVSVDLVGRLMQIVNRFTPTQGNALPIPPRVVGD